MQAKATKLNKLEKLPPLLLNFAYCQDFQVMIEQLAAMAIPEDWSRGGKDYGVLKNYISHTYKRLASLYNNEPEDKNKWIFIHREQRTFACFNTGLYTPNYNQIFALFGKNPIPNQQYFILHGFFDESSYKLAKCDRLPLRAKYFSDINELIFDTTCDIRVNLNHILDDEENLNRIPEAYRANSNLKTLFSGAIDIAKKRIAANYNTAVPQFYENKIQLLIPIALGQDITKTDLVLTVARNGNVYLGKTCLTLEMAYNNARLLAKPEAPWINRSN